MSHFFDALGVGLTVRLAEHTPLPDDKLLMAYTLESWTDVPDPMFQLVNAATGTCEPWPVRWTRVGPSSSSAMVFMARPVCLRALVQTNDDGGDAMHQMWTATDADTIGRAVFAAFAEHAAARYFALVVDFGVTELVSGAYRTYPVLLFSVNRRRAPEAIDARNPALWDAPWPASWVPPATPAQRHVIAAAQRRRSDAQWRQEMRAVLRKKVVD